MGPFVTAECIDIKESTSGGLIQGNYCNGNSLSGKVNANSWINCKGSNYVITRNRGENSIEFGFKVF